MNRAARRRIAAQGRKGRAGYLHRLIGAREHLTAGLHHTIIQHDHWCTIYRGGPCCCEPEISIYKDDGRIVEIDIDGHCRERATS